MDTMSRWVTLGDEPETVTFDTKRGPLSVEANPHEGPGLYEVAINVIWAEPDTKDVVFGVNGDYATKRPEDAQLPPGGETTIERREYWRGGVTCDTCVMYEGWAEWAKRKGRESDDPDFADLAEFLEEARQRHVDAAVEASEH